MIISASRRTDIPSHYSDWFFNRIKAGFVYVRNPRNFHRVSAISLEPYAVDGIVLWTKNPMPMFERLDLLSPYNYYFQFTLTPYSTDIEPNLPSKNDVVIPFFMKLSEKIGRDRVIWRYDPVLLSEKYTMEYHFENFEKIAGRIKDHTLKCTISFIDFYRNTANNIRTREISLREKFLLAKTFSSVTRGFGLEIGSCAEEIELGEFGVVHARCVDEKLFERISGVKLETEKDKNQRKACGCAGSVDIGAYNTCPNGCKYCYANYNPKLVSVNAQKHDSNSPLLYGQVTAEDMIAERKNEPNKRPRSG
jgi:hypothetical protein